MIAADRKRALRFDAVIFDLDGVLFDTEPIHRAAWLSVLSDLGHDVDEQSLMKWTGVPCKDMAQHFAETLEPALPWEEYYRIKSEALRHIAAERLRPFDGLAEVLSELGRLATVGYATSNYRDDARFLLDSSELDRYFVGGVTYDDVERHKPDPEPYLTASGRVDVPAGSCVAVEDSPSGVASASSAGMYVIGITSTFSCEELPGTARCFSATVDACRWLIAQKKATATT